MLLLLIPVLGLQWALRDTSAQTVTQPDAQVAVSEGAAVELRCNYSYGASVSLFWYVQHPGQGPQLLLKYLSGNALVSGIRGFEAEFKKSESSFHLRKASVQGSDAARYFCAAGLNFNIFYFGSGTKLIVKPNITDPQPAVYQLRSSDSKSSNLSMCLLTDFVSQTNVSQRTESETVFTSHTVLNMKSLDSKSYGALAWSQNSSLSCQDAFSNYTFVSSSDASCDAKLVEKSFETDMNLNFQNLSVIGLRLLLLKVAGFNLLMTLRLWSS